MNHSVKPMLKPKYGIYSFLALSMILLLSSCKSDVYFGESHSIHNEAWHMNNIAEFPVSLYDVQQDYRLILSVRNTTDYQYSNIYFFFTTIYPDQTAIRDTIECMLADRSGRWLGSGVGRIRESNFLIREPLHTPIAGEYRFIIQHAMRDEVLSGITDVGVTIEKSQSLK
jgi:gliding motility-associated lipoprotein GldH